MTTSADILELEQLGLLDEAEELRRDADLRYADILRMEWERREEEAAEEKRRKKARSHAAPTPAP